MIKLESIESTEEAINKDDMVLLYFGMDTCGVCQDFKPKIKAVLEDHPKIKAYEIEADKNIKLSAKYNIFTIPGIIVYAEQKEVIREARYMSIHDIEEKISRYYNMLFG